MFTYLFIKIYTNTPYTNYLSNYLRQKKSQICSAWDSPGNANFANYILLTLQTIKLKRTGATF